MRLSVRLIKCDQLCGHAWAGWRCRGQVLRFKYDALCWSIMAKDSARRFVPVIRCRKAGPALAGGELAGWSIGGNKSFLRRPGWGAFRRVVADLREHCPAAKPVVVRTSWMPRNVLGECIRRRHRFVIRLNNRMDQAQAIETTLHEWAHALAWNYSLDRLASEPGISPEVFDAASHDEAWGCAYSRVWRVYSGTGLRAG